jgi:glutaminyl-tRNA synthetase
MPGEIKDDVELLQTIGLSEQKAKETLKNASVTKNLKLAINEVSGLFGNVCRQINFLCLYFKCQTIYFLNQMRK